MGSFWTGVAIALGSLGLLGAVVTLLSHRRLTGRAWRMLAFFGCLLLPVFGLTALSSVAVERSKRTEFCTSCHTMDPYHRSLKADDAEYIPSHHYENNYVNQETACYDCHTDYTWHGGIKGKINGMKHLWVAYVSGPPEKLELYEPYNVNNCLHCHGTAKNFLKKKIHNNPEGRLEKILSGQKSCMSSGCHDVVHEIDEFKEVEEDDE